MTRPVISVLVVDDDVGFSAFVRETINANPLMEVALVVYDGKTALEIARDIEVDAAVVDLHLGNVDGRDVIEALRDRNPYRVIVCLTGSGDPNEHRKAYGAGADIVLPKAEFQDALTVELERAGVPREPR